MPPPAGPVPSDAVLLHIGPHKTGTSAVQSSLNAALDELEAHDVHYLASRQFREYAVMAAVGRGVRAGLRKPSRGDWEHLVREVHRYPDRRVLVSSERYCWADDAQAVAIVDDLGRTRVHVVVTLRPLDRILPSQWQMNVQEGSTRSFDEWLRAVFDDPPKDRTPAGRFWRRQAHGDLVSRWAKAVGPDRVTVIVVDEQDRSMLLRAFADLLDLPPGLLVPVSRKSNRSLTAGEVEMVRLVNQGFEKRGWTREEQAALVRKGVSRRLVARIPDPTEPKILTPSWALEQLAARSETAVKQIRNCGVHVVGNLDSLLVQPKDREDQPESGQVPSRVGALAILGALEQVPQRPSTAPGRMDRAIERLPDRLVPTALEGRERIESATLRLKASKRRWRRRLARPTG